MNAVTIDVDSFLTGARESGLREKQQAYRKGLIGRLAAEVASDLKAGVRTREVAIPVLSGFCTQVIPNGQGQADKAKAMANGMVDSILEQLSATEEGSEGQAQEGTEEPQGSAEEGQGDAEGSEGQGDADEPQATESEAPKGRNRKAA